MERDDIISSVRALEEQLRAMGVLEIGLYGSIARGEARAGSDIDLLVTLGRPAPSLLELTRLRRELAERFRRDVDITTTPITNPFLKREIETDLVPIF